MLRFYKTKSFVIALAVVTLLIALYAVAGFVIAPKLIRSALLKDVPKSMGVTPAVGEIRINPFLFQITVDDFSLAGAGGAPLLGFKRLFVDFELSSLWHRAYSFGNIDLTSPYVNASVAKDGSLNLMQLKPKSPEAPKPAATEKPASLPAIRIGSFKVSQGSVSYEDHSQPDEFAARLEPVNFELREFTTGAEGGQFTFTGASKLGERIEWHGHVSVEPIESDGEFRIDGLLVHTLWEYLQDRLNFVINSGTIDLAATYKFSAGGGPAAQAGGAAGSAPADARPANLQVNVAKVALNDLTVRPKDSDTNWITVPSLSVTGTTVDLAQRQAHVDLVSLTGFKVLTWLEPDGSVNLLKLTKAPPKAGAADPAAAAAPPPAAPTVTASTRAAPAPPWRFDLRQFEVREASLSVEDRTTQPAVKLLLAPFAMQINGASEDLSKPVSVTLDTRVNEKGSLAVTGDITPQPATANLNLKLAGIELDTIQPYIAQHSSMTLLRGALEADAKVHYGAQKDMPAVQFAGNVEIEKLHTVDNALHDDFINWDRLDIRGVNFSQKPDRLDIDQIVARRLYARVIIEPDDTINVKRVLAASAGGAPPPSVPPAATPAPPAAPKKRGQHAPPPAAAPEPAAPSMPMSIKKIIVQAGQANFSDLSVTPNFSAGIQNLEGSIVGLSSKPGSRAKMDLHGSVDKFSPVSIVGEFNVLSPKLFVDVGLDFRNISLPIFNPYSGKFAGYNITEGKLTTELHYKVDGRKLDAQHHVVIEQLEFGDKTASKQAVSLPIKLAVSLLKDRNGVIDLSLPVSGSLDDPQFRLAPIIWKVLVNLLEKAVTAPFALLGSLFGGGPDIQFIAFQPGVATLDAAGADKVKTVAKALVERPQLKIEVPIAAVPDVDRPALITAHYDAELSAAQTAPTGRKKSAAANGIPFDQLDPAAQLELLTQLYAKDFGGAPTYPDTVTGLKSKPDITAAKIDYLSKAVREHIQVGEPELQALGQQRALALQQALLTDTQVSPDRLFLVSNDKATVKDGQVQLELSLK